MLWQKPRQSLVACLAGSSSLLSFWLWPTEVSAHHLVHIHNDDNDDISDNNDNKDNDNHDDNDGNDDDDCAL